MRIASLSPAATEILFALGVSADIVCTDQFSNFPEEAKKIPHVKDHVKVNLDDLKEFKVDLVFTGTVIQEKLAHLLREKEFTVIHQDPRTINAVYESIRELGIIFKKEAVAAQLILSMQQGFNDVKKKAAMMPKRLKLYIEEWHQPPMVSGNWVPEVARFAGGDQFPIKAGELSREVTLEEVIKHDPDLIVISWCGAGSLSDPKLLTGRPGWAALRAVEAGNVRVIDDAYLNRPGPRLVEGARRLYGWMFEMLH